MSGHYVGIDLGGTNMRCLVVDAEAKPLARASAPTLAREGVDSVLARMADLTAKALAEAGLKSADVKAGAVAVPGPVDSRNGIMHSAPNMPGWNSIPVARRMRENTGIEFFLENDANAAAWGEFWAGTAARNKQNLVFLTLGTGVGGAVIVDGKLVEGRDGTAGELGHITVKHNGRQCGCGARGCVEAYASATAIVARFKNAARKGWRSPLERNLDDVDCSDIFEAAADGDPVAARVVDRSGYYLGVAAAVLANILNPECCLVGGGVAQAGDLILDPMRRECRRRCYTPGRDIPILPASLGPDAGLFGAAGQALERSRR